jgi:hypothetical protein
MVSRMVWGKDQVRIYFCAWHLHLMEKIKDNGVHHAILDNLHSLCTCPLNWVKTFKPSQVMGEIRSLKAWPNIWLVIHALGTFGLIIFNLVCDLIFNPLLLFHHVVCIPKYPFLKLRKTPMIPCGYYVSCHRFVDGWVFNKCHIQTKTHKHPLNLTLGHWNVGFL